MCFLKETLLEIAMLPMVTRNDMGSSNFETMLNYK
jgi:hypothetical protein